MMTAGLLVLAALVAGSASAADPQRASDRMGWSRGTAHPGWRADADLTSRETIPGELQTRLCVRRESARGLGGLLEYTSIWSDPSRSAGSLGASAILGFGKVRTEVGASRLWWETEGITRARLGVRTRPRESVLLGATWEGSPGDAHGSQLQAHVVLGGDFFWAGLRAGPQRHAWSAAVGILPAPGLAVWLEWVDAPTLGAAFAWSGVELRARQTRHDLLGLVHSLAIVLGAS